MDDPTTRRCDATTDERRDESRSVRAKTYVARARPVDRDGVATASVESRVRRAGVTDARGDIHPRAVDEEGRV